MNVVACRTALPALAALFILGCSTTKEAIDWHDGDLPQTVAEAVDQLVEGLDERSMSRVKFTPEDELIRFHLGWGASIRNSFGLWGKNVRLLRDCDRRAGQQHIHPESCSQLIIEAVWARLQTVDLPYWPDPVPTVHIDSLVIVSADAQVDLHHLTEQTERLSSHISYPELARRARLQGQSVVEFAVDENGMITRTEQIRRLGGGTDEMVVDALHTVPFIVITDKGISTTATFRVYVSFEQVQPPPQRNE